MNWAQGAIHAEKSLNITVSFCRCDVIGTTCRGPS